jgi:hypothetical protein
MSRGFDVQSVEAMGGSGEPKSASALRTMGKFSLGPKASKVWNKFPWSSKAYSKAFLSLKLVKALGLRANTGSRLGSRNHQNAVMAQSILNSLTAYFWPCSINTTQSLNSKGKSYTQ